MKIVVEHIANPGAGHLLGMVTAQVIHEWESGAVQELEPVVLKPGQKLTWEVGCSEKEYPGGGIESCFPVVGATEVQPGEPSTGERFSLSPTYKQALGTDEELLDRADRQHPDWLESDGLNPITAEEARTLHAVWAGDAFDAEHLESVQPKLEAIAGESWR